MNTFIPLQILHLLVFVVFYMILQILLFHPTQERSVVLSTLTYRASTCRLMDRSSVGLVNSALNVFYLARDELHRSYPARTFRIHKRQEALAFSNSWHRDNFEAWITETFGVSAELPSVQANFFQYCFQHLRELATEIPGFILPSVVVDPIEFAYSLQLEPEYVFIFNCLFSPANDKFAIHRFRSISCRPENFHIVKFHNRSTILPLYTAISVNLSPHYLPYQECLPAWLRRLVIVLALEFLMTILDLNIKLAAIHRLCDHSVILNILYQSLEYLQIPPLYRRLTMAGVSILGSLEAHQSSPMCQVMSSVQHTPLLEPWEVQEIQELVSPLLNHPPTLKFLASQQVFQTTRHMVRLLPSPDNQRLHCLIPPAQSGLI